MNALTVALFACVFVLASAAPGGVWGGYGGYGVHGHGHLPVVGASGVVSSGGAVGPAGVVNGHGAVGPNGILNAIGHGGIWGAGVGAWDDGDDGQWHGEGLLASQDLAGHGGAIIAPGVAGIIGGHGLGLGLGGLGGLGLGLGVHGLGVHGHGHW